MKRTLSRLVEKGWRRWVGQRVTTSLIDKLTRLGGINPLTYAYRRMGILKYEDFEISGEAYVMREVLPACLSRPNPVFFDVGANRGDYTKRLGAQFPTAEIYSFEPNPDAFRDLCMLLRSPRFYPFEVAMADVAESRLLYSNATEPGSSHSSLHREVITEIHHELAVAEERVQLDTIDSFCVRHGIESIDFLKIDTEGYELKVLAGAERMLRSKRIRMIQFEFNTMNVTARVFLKDFYSILSDYHIHRIDTSRLISLRDYDPINEIFLFQNFLAVLRD